MAQDIRFGRSCQYYGKFSRKIPDFKLKLPQMVAIPERYCDRADPYIIWLWIADEKEFHSWRRALGDSLKDLRFTAPRIEVLSEEGKKQCANVNGNVLSDWELYWIQMEKI